MYLKTKRLYLKEFEENQGYLFEELDSNDNVVKFTGKTKMTTAQGNQFISKLKAEMYQEGLGFYACYQVSDDAFIGWFHLRKEMGLDTDVLEIGYRLKEEYWSLGYATEMSNALLDYGFDIADIISAITLNENIASQNVMLKLNMTYDKNLDYHGFDVMRFTVNRGDHLYKKMKVTDDALNYCKQIEPNFENLTTNQIAKKYLENPLIALIESIIMQQVSIKSGQTVWRKFCKTVWPITAHNILEISDEKIQRCGLSFRKVTYIKNVATYYKENTTTFNKIDELSDEQIVKFLTAIKGIGPWTANIFLMFTLRRENHSTYLDLILRRMASLNLGLDDISESEYDTYLQKFSPNKTTASLCLWAQSKTN